MFKSIEYKLIFYLLLLVVSVVFATYLVIDHQYIYVSIPVLAFLFSLNKLYTHYNKFNQNILFLLNALENGDYSFHFAETKMSKREAELNKMMNRIKEILSQAKKEIIENERFLSLIVESVSVGIIILDEKNMIRTTNQATNELLGMPVFTHLNQLGNIDEEFPQLFRNLKAGENKQIQVVNEREETQISLSASQIILKKGAMKIITLSNIGNELEAKEMESWIRLIRVMTHEIMNSIAPITSLTDTLLFSYKADDGSNGEILKENTIDALETISTTAKGLVTFVDSYRRFTGVPKPQLCEFELLPLLEKILHLESKHMENKGVKSFLQCEPSVILSADESQVTQVLINLIKNAIESIPAASDGEIRVQVAQQEKKLLIRVSNNGAPIPEDVLPHIFIPFFTTKDTGTGIGLSVSRYMMRLHGGNLKHRTDGDWTVFSMVFFDK